MAYHLTHTVGERKGPRIPLKYEELSSHGFPAGTPISIAYDFDNRAIVITPHSQSSHTVPNASHDVINLQNEDIDRLFPDGTRVVVSYRTGLIQIRANNDIVADSLGNHKQNMSDRQMARIDVLDS